MKYIKIFSIALFLALSVVNAVDISLTFVRNAFENNQNVAIDTVTGKFYSHQYSSSSYIRVYNTASDFANNAYSTVNLSSASIYNNYFAVENGKVFGRRDSSTSAIASWDANTGALLATNTLNNMVGNNGGTGGFSWGGYSSVNWFNDGGKLYVLGKTTADSSNYQWRITQVNQNLQETATQVFDAAGTLGYAFVINGKLFTATNYSQNSINKVYDLATGTMSSVSYNILTGGSSFYWRDASYDAINDTVYFYNNSDNSFYKVANASVVFNAPSTVPEPQTLFLLGLVIVSSVLFKNKGYFLCKKDVLQ
ncbi:MAG: hypothetical protein HUU50_17760 [Candidatus Brocadiae bacterium]|nr:hypothetical protein [Candidatus Brocadiia bacterium]